MYDEITQVGMNKLIIFVSDPHGYHRKTYFNRPMLISNQDNKIIRQALKKKLISVVSYADYANKEIKQIGHPPRH